MRIMEILLEKVVQIVKKAAQITLKPIESIDQKDGYANIVTSADKSVQDFLYDNLRDLVPDSGFICEEEDFHTAGSGGYTWIIDPIDGTANFSRHIPEFAISVALKHTGGIVLGVVYNPLKDELFTAIKGKKAFRNGQEISVSARPFADSLLCTAMSIYNKKYAKVCSDIIMDAYYKCNDVRRFGACALEICYLAAGQCDLFFEYRVMPWDYAAAYLIFTEAGGTLTDLNGGKLYFNRPTMLIGGNTPENHNILSSIVGKYVAPDYYEYR